MQTANPPLVVAVVALLVAGLCIEALTTARVGRRGRSLSKASTPIQNAHSRLLGMALCRVGSAVAAAHRSESRCKRRRFTPQRLLGAHTLRDGVF